MPMLKGAVEAFAAIARLAAWERRREEPARVRAAAAGLAGAGRGSRAVGPRRGARPARPLGGGRPPCRAARAREPRAALAAAGVPGDRVAARSRRKARRPSRRGATSAAARSRSSSTRRSSPTRATPAGSCSSLADGAAIELAVDALLAAAARAGVEPRGLLVEPMAAPGVELIVGGRRDAVFGPAVLVGFGGILAEVLDDVAVLLAPVGRAEVVDRLAGPAWIGAAARRPRLGCRRRRRGRRRRGGGGRPARRRPGDRGDRPQPGHRGARRARWPSMRWWCWGPGRPDRLRPGSSANGAARHRHGPRTRVTKVPPRMGPRSGSRSHAA